MSPPFTRGPLSGGAIVAAGGGGGFTITRPLLVGTGRGDTAGGLPGGIIGTVLGAIEAEADALALVAMLADVDATGACVALVEASVRVLGDSAWISSRGGRAQASSRKGAESAAEASASCIAPAVGRRDVRAAARSGRGTLGASSVTGRFRRVSFIGATSPPF
jgi:hypothetical protein